MLLNNLPPPRPYSMTDDFPIVYSFRKQPLFLFIPHTTLFIGPEKSKNADVIETRIRLASQSIQGKSVCLLVFLDNFQDHFRLYKENKFITNTKINIYRVAPQKTVLHPYNTNHFFTIRHLFHESDLRQVNTFLELQEDERKSFNEIAKLSEIGKTVFIYNSHTKKLVAIAIITIVQLESINSKIGIAFDVACSPESTGAKYALSKFFANFAFVYNLESIIFPYKGSFRENGMREVSYMSGMSLAYYAPKK